MTTDIEPSTHRSQQSSYMLNLQPAAEDQASAVEVHQAAQLNYVADPSASNFAVLLADEKTLTRAAVRCAGLQTLAVTPDELVLRFAFEPDGTPLVLRRSIVDPSSLAAIAEHLEMASIAALTALSEDKESGLSAGSAPGTFTLDLRAVQGICNPPQSRASS